MAFPLVHPVLHPGTFDETVDLMVRGKAKLPRARVGYKSMFQAKTSLAYWADLVV